jgi:hypothetical protein
MHASERAKCVQLPSNMVTSQPEMSATVTHAVANHSLVIACSSQHFELHDQ